MSVNGRAARLGDRARRSDRIALDGNPVALATAQQPARVLVYHKPVGELVTRRDPGGRPTVFERLPPLAGAKWVAVGRLDINSCGLLLLTDSGELANRLMHPRYEIEREYAVRVLGELAPHERLRLLQGVALEEGPARFMRIDGGEQDGQAANRWYRVTLVEGRNREVRRLFEALGKKVNRLIRVRYGPIVLPRDLPPGRWREIEPREVARLGPLSRHG